MLNESQQDLSNLRRVTRNPESRERKKQQTEEDLQEGFAEDEQLKGEIFVKQELTSFSHNATQTKKINKFSFKEPKLSISFDDIFRLELTFISKDLQNSVPLHRKKAKQADELHMKSLDIKRLKGSTSNNDISKLTLGCAVKLSRNFVGDNISYTNHCSEQGKKIKHAIVSSGAKLVYEFVREGSTYAHIGMLKANFSKKTALQSTEDSPQSSKSSVRKNSGEFFLENNQNLLIKTKLKESLIHPRKREALRLLEPIEFDGSFESANIEFVARVKKNEYEVYLRSDTNTHGHQNWFYFAVSNGCPEKQNLKISVVNMKRNLNLVEHGQRLFYRKRSKNALQSEEWKICGKHVSIKENSSLSEIYRGRVYRFSFEIELEGDSSSYEVSLLPPYTYSDLLSDIELLNRHPQAPQTLTVGTLTYSLTGLSIPILTFTSPSPTNISEFTQNGHKNEETSSLDMNKEVILISARIHPGETVASHMVRGLMQKLIEGTSAIKEFLKHTIVKVIPMINPDGVVFGNFRTNFLGYDLNRSFQSDDEITNPEVVALKQLGKKLKRQYGEKFSTFIDMHGHSGQKNIFTYGPDFDPGHEMFYKARLLPKLLGSKSAYFSYEHSTFKLQEYKVNTARGFFLNSLNVNAYTIESSYALYENTDGKDCVLTPNEWRKFGMELCETFELMHRLNKTHSIKNRTQLKRALSLSKEEEEKNMSFIKSLRKEIKKEEKRKRESLEYGGLSDADTLKNGRKLRADEDSDGQNSIEDLDCTEREEMEKKLVENSVKSSMFPRVLKPSVVYPTVTPKLFSIDDSSSSSYKILYTRRNRYHSIKMPNSSYIQGFQGAAEVLKPNARILRVERNMSSTKD